MASPGNVASQQVARRLDKDNRYNNQYNTLFKDILRFLHSFLKISLYCLLYRLLSAEEKLRWTAPRIRHAPGRASVGVKDVQDLHCVCKTEQVGPQNAENGRTERVC